MNIYDELKQLGQRADEIESSLQTEEAVKNALVLPFIRALGYDIHNPIEVIPEYTADFATKKGEKVDYAISINNSLAMIFECKQIRDNVDAYTGQLFRYFSVTEARIAVLTNGRVYKFFSDLSEPNKLDTDPFYILDLSTIRESVGDDIQKLTKEGFDLDGMLSRAVDLKYIREIKQLLMKEFDDPTWLAMELLSNSSFKGRRTQGVVDWFSKLTKRALRSIENDHLRSIVALATEEEEEDIDTREEPEDGIVTTMEEIEGFHYVKGMVRDVIDPDRVYMRDTQSYCGIIIDDNNRKPLCRLRFNNLDKKALTIGRSLDQIPIDKVSDVMKYADEIRAEAASYIE